MAYWSWDQQNPPIVTGPEDSMGPGAAAAELFLTSFAFLIPLPGIGCWCLKNFQISSRTIITIWPAGSCWWRWGARECCPQLWNLFEGVAWGLLKFLQSHEKAQSDWKADFSVAVCYAESKKCGAEKIQSPAPWLPRYATRLWNLCSCVSLFNKLLCKYQVLAVRWVRGPGIFFLSKTSPRVTEAKPAIPHPLFGLNCTIYQSAMFMEHHMSTNFWTAAYVKV